MKVAACLRGMDRATGRLVAQALSGLTPEAWAAEEARKDRAARAEEVPYLVI